jgi:hypothetical protein
VWVFDWGRGSPAWSVFCDGPPIEALLWVLNSPVGSILGCYCGVLGFQVVIVGWVCEFGVDLSFIVGWGCVLLIWWLIRG